MAFPNSATFLSHFRVWTPPIKRVSLQNDSFGTSAYRLNSPSSSTQSFISYIPGLNQVGDTLILYHVNRWGTDNKLSIAKLDFVQVCGLLLNFYNNTLRTFYKFSYSRQDWTCLTLQSADWPISRQYHRPQMRKRMSYPKVQVYPESLAQSAYGDLDIMYNELMTSWVYNNIIGLWYHMGYLFRNGFICIVRRCKLLNPENIGSYHQINKICEFLQFSSKRKGIRAWNFRMMIRKIWRFLWYQNRNNFKKNKKKKGPSTFKRHYRLQKEATT